LLDVVGEVQRASSGGEEIRQNRKERGKRTGEKNKQMTCGVIYNG
jgi:hypothetical protein